jgi:hypothetical protein
MTVEFEEQTYISQEIKRGGSKDRNGFFTKIFVSTGLAKDPQQAQKFMLIFATLFFVVTFIIIFF